MPNADAAGTSPVATTSVTAPISNHHDRTDRLRLPDAAVAPCAAKRPGVAGIGAAVGMSGEGLPVAASDYDRMETAS